TVVCTSSTSTSGIFTAMRAMASRPIHFPTAHSRRAPTSEPTVAKTIAKAMLICPWLEVKPARGRTISLGMGGKMVSRKTMIPDADRPQCFHDGHRPCGEAAEMLRCSVAGGQHEIGPGTGQRSCRHGQKCR